MASSRALLGSILSDIESDRRHGKTSELPELYDSGEYELAAVEMHPAKHHHYSEREKALMDSYEALDYDIVQNRIRYEMRARQTAAHQRIEWFANWAIYFFVGFITGSLAFLIDLAVEKLSDWKFTTTLRLVDKNDMFGAFAVFALISLMFCLISTLLVSFIEPVAGGSGIPELKGYLNGTNYLRVLRMKTLIVKAIGVVFSVSGGLAIGKEGPLVHSGAAVAANLSHGPKLPELLNTKRLKRFRNDHDKRDFVSGGAAAGVAAAFGAPLGGVLFSLEEAASFWSLPLTWRVFFCAMVSTFSLHFWQSLYRGESDLNSAGLITFGNFDDMSCSAGSLAPVDDHKYRAWELPIFWVLGVIGGVCGALFNAINIRICKWRRDVVAISPIRRVAEVCAIGFVSCIFQFVAPVIVSGCNPTPLANETAANANYRTFRCDPGQYNDMATLIFSPLEQSIKAQFHNRVDLSQTALIVYLILIFILAVTTYGLFVPCILIGSGYGRAIGEALSSWFPSSNIDAGIYALVGAASMLGGVTRMTISLTVILLETTDNLKYLLPIMMVLMVSKWVGDSFNISLYDMHVEIKCIPFVEATPPRYLRDRFARDVMTRRVIKLCERETVGRILHLLRTTHNGFPVIRYFDDRLDDPYSAISLDRQLRGAPGGAGASAEVKGDSSEPTTGPESVQLTREDYDVDLEQLEVHTECKPVCTGVILRNELVLLLQRRAFYHRSERPHRRFAYMFDLDLDDFAGSLSSKIASLNEEDFTPAEMECEVDLRPFMNPAPFTVQENWPLTRVYRLYRSMGVRHLPVVDVHNNLVGVLSRKILQTDFNQDLS